MKSIAENTWQLIANIFTAILNFVKGFVEGIIAFFKGLWYALVGGSIIPDIVNGALGWFQKFLSGVNQTVGALVSNVKSAFNSIAGIIQNVVGSAWQWGANLTNSLAKGIRSGIGQVSDAVKSVAGKISDILGFHSPAKDGPGAYADYWAPNLMKMLNDGLREGIPQLNTTLNAALSPDFLRKPALVGLSPATLSEGANQRMVEHTGVVMHRFETNDRQVVAQVVEQYNRDSLRLPTRVNTIPIRA
ncbi:MAG: hypothetical protein U9N81_08465 [Bacillota bacterium]|nr:hypothetical protein [Bacillota bacterium]